MVAGVLRPIVVSMHEKVLVVRAAPIDAARLDWALYGPLSRKLSVLVVEATEAAVTGAGAADLLEMIERALRSFDATRIVVAAGAPDRGRDITGEIEDRFGRPVMAVATPV